MAVGRSNKSTLPTAKKPIRGALMTSDLMPAGRDIHIEAKPVVVF
jgi:hypothetical protein